MTKLVANKVRVFTAAGLAGIVFALALPFNLTGDPALIVAKIAAVCLTLSVPLSAIAYLRRCPRPSQPQNFRRGEVGLLALPSLIVFILTLAGTWPAQMSYDSLDQWTQITSGVFNNSHPILQTLLFAGIGRLAGTPAGTIIFQILLLSLVLAGTLRELGNWNVPRYVLWGAAVLLPLFPPLNLLSTVFWKDVAYAIALVALTWVTLVLVRTRARAARSPWFIAAFAVTTFAVSSFRHNGLLISGGVVLLLLLYFRRQLSKTFATATLAAAIVLPLGVDFAVVPALHIPNLPPQYKGIVPLHALAGLEARGDIDDAALQRKLDGILPHDQWATLYDCYNVTALFWHRGIHYDRIDGSLYFDLLRQTLRHPLPVLEHFACVTSLAWRISPAPINLMPLRIDPGWGPSAPIYHPVQPLAKLLNEEATLTQRNVVLNSLIWRPATQLFILFCICTLAMSRKRATCLLLLTSPVWINTGSLLLFIGSQDYRYQYGTVIVALLLSLLFAFGGDLQQAEQGGVASRAEPSKPATLPESWR